MTISSSLWTKIGVVAGVVATVIAVTEFFGIRDGQMKKTSIVITPNISISNSNKSTAIGGNSNSTSISNVTINNSQIDNRVSAEKDAIVIIQRANENRD